MGPPAGEGGQAGRHGARLQSLTNPWFAWDQPCRMDCVRSRAGTGKFYASCLFSNSFLSPTPSGNDKGGEARPSGAVGRSGREKVLDSDRTWEA